MANITCTGVSTVKSLSIATVALAAATLILVANLYVLALIGIGQVRKLAKTSRLNSEREELIKLESSIKAQEQRLRELLDESTIQNLPAVPGRAL